MRVIIFDLQGKFAHFRKFFTTSSSLSYSVPPRTTIAGLIAAILGRERDSYYAEFASDKLQIAVRKMGKTRKFMQTLNYIKATSTKDLIAPKLHTQIPFEIVTGEPGVHYRVYVAHQNVELLDEIYERVCKSKYIYPPYLGVAPFAAHLTPIAQSEAQPIETKDYIPVSTVIRQDYIAADGIKIEDASCLLKEKMPTDFDAGRCIKSVNSYIYDENGRVINIKPNCAVRQIQYAGVTENILFL